MASRINKRQLEQTKDAIRTTQLVKRLQNHVLEDEGAKNYVDMSLTQVNAAKFLINLKLPLIKQTEFTGELEHILPTSIKIVLEE